MKDRIKKYMDYRSISAGELADLLEVQRSNISHVLNGRNKPGASFIEKLLLSFPELDARWLLTGEGTMLQTNAEIDTAEPGKEVQRLIEPAPKFNHSLKPIVEGNGNKLIEKMVVLYTDGTFSDYNKRR